MKHGISSSSLSLPRSIFIKWYGRCLHSDMTFARRCVVQGVKGLDLRLEDIFLDSEHNVLKVIDFGYRLKTKNGEVFSLPYVTPEQLRHPQRSEEFRKVFCQTDICEILSSISCRSRIFGVLEWYCSPCYSKPFHSCLMEIPLKRNASKCA